MSGFLIVKFTPGPSCETGRFYDDITPGAARPYSFQSPITKRYWIPVGPFIG